LFLKKQLRERQLSYNSILKKGQELWVAPKANIAAGAVITNYTEKVSTQTSKWAKNLAQILKLRVCGIDIFAQEGFNNRDSFTIIEVNSNPSLVGIYEYGRKEKVLKIWQEILKKYFE